MGLRCTHVEHVRHWQRKRLGDWASRHGYFDEARALDLESLARRGIDPEFTARTGFSLYEEWVEFSTDWAVIQWETKAVSNTDAVK